MGEILSLYSAEGFKFDFQIFLSVWNLNITENKWDKRFRFQTEKNLSEIQTFLSWFQTEKNCPKSVLFCPNFRQIKTVFIPNIFVPISDRKKLSLFQAFLSWFQTVSEIQTFGFRTFWAKFSSPECSKTKHGEIRTSICPDFGILPISDVRISGLYCSEHALAAFEQLQ